MFISHYNGIGIKLVRPRSTVDNTRDYARVSHSSQWSNCNIIIFGIFLFVGKRKAHTTQFRDTGVLHIIEYKLYRRSSLSKRITRQLSGRD